MVWAVIPVKSLEEAKSSFREILTPDQRKELVLSMLADVLTVLRDFGMNTVVVSPDEDVLKFASRFGAEGLKEPGLDLNDAMRLAVQNIMERGAREVLMLPADLPFIKSVDLENMLGMVTSDKEVVIAPSRTGGTNALFLRPPDLIDLKFGGKSFPLHVAESVKVGIRPKVYSSPTISVDVDEAGDLLKAETLGLGTRTREFLVSLLGRK